MENKSKLFVIPVEMENRDPKDVARDAAERIVLLMDMLVKQMQNDQGTQKKTE